MTEADDLLALAEGGHSFRLVGPRRYGKTTLLRRVLDGRRAARTSRRCWSTSRTCSRSGRSWSGSSAAMTASRGRSGGRVDNFFRSWNIGLALGGGGFTATLQRNPHVDAESVLLRLLELPTALFERDGTTSLIVFDEIQDVLAVPGADGKIRSVIQHQGEAATYAFAGSAPGVMQQLFADPQATAARPGGAQEPRAAAAGGRSPTTSPSASTDRARCRDGADADAGVHARAPAAQHDARPLPLAAHAAGDDRRREGHGWQHWTRPPRDSAPLMRAIWRALPVNERRVARALALTTTPLYSEETAVAVGIKRASIGRALESLVSNADVIEGGDRPRLTDPMFELWLKARGLTPETGDEVTNDD